MIMSFCSSTIVLQFLIPQSKAFYLETENFGIKIIITTTWYDRNVSNCVRSADTIRLLIKIDDTDKREYYELESLYYYLNYRCHRRHSEYGQVPMFAG